MNWYLIEVNLITSQRRCNPVFPSGVHTWSLYQGIKSAGMSWAVASNWTNDIGLNAVESKYESSLIISPPKESQLQSIVRKMTPDRVSLPRASNRMIYRVLESPPANKEYNLRRRLNCYHFCSVCLRIGLVCQRISQGCQLVARLVPVKGAVTFLILPPSKIQGGTKSNILLGKIRWGLLL